MVNLNQNKEEAARKKTQLIAVFKAYGNWRSLARELNVPQATAYRWISQGEKKRHKK